MDPEVCESVCTLLRKARDLTYQWINDLSAKLESTQDELSREGLRRRLCMLAVTCFSTFDVCPEYIPRIFSDESDLSIAIQCAIIVHDNTPSSLADDNTFYLTRMLRRHHRLLHTLEPVFSFYKVPANLSLQHEDGYDHAVSSFWPSYRRSTSSLWRALPRPDSRWISCLAEGGQKIHYNLLTGQLLVDGKPLGKLPQEIIEHPTYADILGAVSVMITLLYVLNLSQRVLDVVPSDVLGMEFMTRSTVSGYQVSMAPSWYSTSANARRRSFFQGEAEIYLCKHGSQEARNYYNSYPVLRYLEISRGILLMNTFTGSTRAPVKLNFALLNLHGHPSPPIGVSTFETMRHYLIS